MVFPAPFGPRITSAAPDTVRDSRPGEMYGVCRAASQPRQGARTRAIIGMAIPARIARSKKPAPKTWASPPMASDRVASKASAAEYVRAPARPGCVDRGEDQTEGDQTLPHRTRPALRPDQREIEHRPQGRHRRRCQTEPAPTARHARE